jgi:hypothetical protein
MHADDKCTVLVVTGAGTPGTTALLLRSYQNYTFMHLRVYVLEGLVAVVNRVTCSVPVPGSTLYVHACHPRGALPTPGLAGCPVGREE